MLAVNVMRMCESTAEPEPRTQGLLADDDDEDATVGVLGLVRATSRTPSRETDPGAIPGLTPSERRKTALRVGYAACLLPG